MRLEFSGVVWKTGGGGGALVAEAGFELFVFLPLHLKYHDCRRAPLTIPSLKVILE